MPGVRHRHDSGPAAGGIKGTPAAIWLACVLGQAPAAAGPGAFFLRFHPGDPQHVRGRRRFALTTPVGTFIHSGDFKIDATPTAGEATDLNGFADYGNRGVLALLSDSTNAERPGYTLSEREIGRTLENLIREAQGRVIVAVFSITFPGCSRLGHRGQAGAQDPLPRPQHGDQRRSGPPVRLSQRAPGTGDEGRGVEKPAGPGNHRRHHRQPGGAHERPGPDRPGLP